MDAIEFIRQQVVTMSALKRGIESNPALENRDAAIAAITEAMSLLESHIARQVKVVDLLPALKEHGFEMNRTGAFIERSVPSKPAIRLIRVKARIVISWGFYSLAIELLGGYWHIADETGDIPEEDKGLPAIVIAALEDLK